MNGKAVSELVATKNTGPIGRMHLDYNKGSLLASMSARPRQTLDDGENTPMPWGKSKSGLVHGIMFELSVQGG